MIQRCSDFESRGIGDVEEWQLEMNKYWFGCMTTTMFSVPLKSWVDMNYISPDVPIYLHTSRKCLYWNQLFWPSPAFTRRQEAIFLCWEQKQKQLGHEASPLLGPPSGTNCLMIWGTLLWVYLFSNKDWNRICLNNVDLRYSLNWQ